MSYVFVVGLVATLAGANYTEGPTSSSSPEATLPITTLHWNAHRPCATDDPPCVAAAQKRLGEMAKQVGAQLVGAVELKDAVTALPGWQSTGMQCDNSVVMVAPGWSVKKAGGWCMNGDSVKGFAVALVQPPQPLQGCSSLCVFMGHVPHGSGYGITGHSEIENVCGGAVVGACVIAMGDWNADDISSRWQSLFSGSPTLVEPHDKTCCETPALYVLETAGISVNGKEKWLEDFASKGAGVHTCYEAVMRDPDCAKDYFTYVAHAGQKCGCNEESGLKIRAEANAGIYRIHQAPTSTRWGSFTSAFDHTATNIAGAYSVGKTVFGPQLTAFKDYDEHKPTSVQLRLPLATLARETGTSETFFA